MLKRGSQMITKNVTHKNKNLTDKKIQSEVLNFKNEKFVVGKL